MFGLYNFPRVMKEACFCAINDAPLFIRVTRLKPTDPPKAEAHATFFSFGSFHFFQFFQCCGMSSGLAIG